MRSDENTNLWLLISFILPHLLKPNNGLLYIHDVIIGMLKTKASIFYEKKLGAIIEFKQFE